MSEPMNLAGQSRQLSDELEVALAEFAVKVDGVPFMDVDQARRVWSHFAVTRPTDVLDVGTCYGASAVYFAGGLKTLGIEGRVRTIDSALFDGRSDALARSEALWARCGVRDMIEVVRTPHSSYAWELRNEVVAATSESGQLVAPYDFIYLDGGKWLPIDGTAATFAASLLRPEGWLLLDDLDWRFDTHTHFTPTVVLDNDDRYPLSPEEQRTPHLRAVWEDLVRHHPAFDLFIEQDGGWGWARKGDRPVRRALIERQRRPLNLRAKLGRAGAALGLRPMYRRLTGKSDQAPLG